MGSVKSIKALFTQHVEVDILKEKQVSSGIFYYMKPCCIKWEQTHPDTSIFILTDNRVMTYDFGRKRTMSQAGQVSAFKKLIMEVINGKIFSSDDFTKKYAVKGDVVTVQLIPVKKRIMNQINRLDIFYSIKSRQLNGIDFLFENGDQRKISFSNQEFNKVSSQEFNLE